jgi:hypothetical protein
MLLGIMYQTASLCAEWTQLQKDHSNDPQQLLNESFNFVEKAQILDRELEVWMQARGPEWNVPRIEVRNVTIPSWLTELYKAPGAPSSLLISSTFHIGHKWNFWRGTRLILNQFMLSAIDVQLSVAKPTTSQIGDFTTLQSLLELRILELVGDICDAVYASLTLPLSEKPEAKTIDEVCGLRGYTLLWPLYRAGMVFKRTNLSAIDVDGRSGWVKSTMKFISDGLAIAKAQGFLNNMNGVYGDLYV